ncbi:unnamed protein product [Cylicocyclus nassatus]|uniref:Uncharacterized protein n=1 Tax=Cylicocyclus nassatus TaxID=53992 RepID=A0AA36GPR0_CYLNA|nr:unnamed protein product [Cylicocyclus nassatus]
MWAILFVTSVLAENACDQRCNRIYQRSLARPGFDDDKLENLLDRQRPLGTLKDMCWRVYDHLDCMKHCGGDAPEHEKFAKYIRSKCRFALRGMENALACISRYHSFIEVRCSTFLKEAERLKSKTDPAYTPSQETCRYLHLNTLCLENTVRMYCANAKKIFRRLNYRDYFLSFVLPTNDTLFDDEDLDACQLYDFAKKNRKKIEKEVDEEELTTVINDFETEEETRRPRTTVTTFTDRTEFTTLIKELLDESTEPTASSLIKPTPEKDSWSSPSLKTLPTKSTSPTSSTASRTSSLLSTTDDVHSSATKQYTESTSPDTAVITTSTDKIITSLDSTVITTSTDEVITSTHSDDGNGSEEEEYEDEKEEDYHDEKPENISVEVVSIQTAERKQEVTETPRMSTTTTRRLFSDDSWEQPPPNFGYSSMRYPNGGVTPLNIDTSTLFGMDDGDKEEEGEETDRRTSTRPYADNRKDSLKKVDVRKAENAVKASVRFASRPAKESQRGPIYVTQRVSVATTSTTEMPTTEKIISTTSASEALTTSASEVMSTITPMLRGEVAVKRIHEWNDVTQSAEYGVTLMTDRGDDEFDGTDEDMDQAVSVEPVEPKKITPEIGSTTLLPRLNIDWSRETLILIYSLLFAIATFSLMCILICYIWCRKRRQSHDFKTNY